MPVAGQGPEHQSGRSRSGAAAAGGCGVQRGGRQRYLANPGGRDPGGALRRWHSQQEAGPGRQPARATLRLLDSGLCSYTWNGCAEPAYAQAMPAQIFGRDAELRTIREFVGRLAGAPGAIVLAGPAGAGKTTLLRSGGAMAGDHQFTVLQTSPSQSDLRLAFAGLTDLLEPHVAAVIGELPRPQAQALGIALLLRRAAGRPPEPRVIAAAFRTALGVLAQSGPVLLVVDDLQWLDPPSAAALGFALRRLTAEPVGLLCAQRTDHDDELPLELRRGVIRADMLPVGALSLGALHRMLRTRIGTSFSHPTLRRIEAESGGNPSSHLRSAVPWRAARSAVSGRPRCRCPIRWPRSCRNTWPSSRQACWTRPGWWR